MSRYVLRGADVLVGDTVRCVDVAVADGVVTSLIDRSAEPGAPTANERSSAPEIDLAGLTLVPGFVDIQLNGIGGIDFCSDPHRIADAAGLLPRFGVTSFLPTIVTSPPATVRRAIDWVRSMVPDGAGARVLGLHLEGPMLAPARVGAHSPDLLRPPSLDLVADWSSEGGVALVTLAPELDGAHEVIAALRRRGVVVFAGHTAATTAQMEGAVDAGVTGLTHLFNAMPPLGHREPGPVGVALTDPRLVAGLIVDGVHVDRRTVALAFACLGPDRLVLVSDAVAAAGMAPGRYQLGRIEVVTDGVSVRLEDGTLAGSMLTLDAAVRNLRAWTGCPLSVAARCASTVAARAIGRPDLGQIGVGLPADVVALTDDGVVALTMIGGRVAYDARR